MSFSVDDWDVLCFHYVLNWHSCLSLWKEGMIFEQSLTDSPPPPPTCTLHALCHRSYGILLYEFVTAGSVPYASLSNLEVKSKVCLLAVADEVTEWSTHLLSLWPHQVLEGYRLPQPPTCLDDFYAVMMKCWSLQPAERPSFPLLLTSLLDPLESKLAR